jgi:hypothetical protein
VPVSIDLSSSLFRLDLPELVAVFFFFGSADLSVPVSVVVAAGLSAGAAVPAAAGGAVVVAAGAAAAPAAAAGAVVVAAPPLGVFWADATPAPRETIAIAVAMKQSFCM